MNIKAENIKKIVVHGHCPDGTASAILLKDALPEAEVIFSQYGTDDYKKLPAEPGMIFCDICPPPERAHEFIEAGTIVLDHHRTARHSILRYGANGVYADEPGVCGAVLAYRYVWEPLVKHSVDEKYAEWVARFAKLAGIRDTWQDQDPLWNEACKQANVLSFRPPEVWLKTALPQLAATWEESYSWVGAAVADKQEHNVKRSIRSGNRLVSAKGTRIIAFNSTTVTSDAAQVLGSEVDLVAGFFFEAGEEPRMVLSCRSHTNFDCASFAAQFGGGGHTKAAGLSIPCQEKSPYQAVLDLVNQYEGN